MSSTHSQDIAEGERFRFGANWRAFLSTLTEQQIIEAENSLREMLGHNSLSGKTFLDIGSGSGLFSLAAKRLGAESVHSFDYDPQSVACAVELKQRYFAEDRAWKIEEASALDRQYVESLGKFDVVYSWGVLHHTGDMWTALENAAIPLGSRSFLFIAIYNDQGFRSKLWNVVKRTYCWGVVGRLLVKSVFIPYFFFRSMAVGLIRNMNPFSHFANYKKQRGMSIYHDWIDWLGGYPYEVASPKQIEDFFRDRHCELIKSVTTKRLGCNQFVFRKKVSQPD